MLKSREEGVIDSHSIDVADGQNHVRVDKDLIDALGFIVTSLLLSDLLLKTQSLLERVIQLGVCVAELLATHEALEPLT